MITSAAACGPWCGSASAGTAQVEHDTFTDREPHGGLIEYHVGRIVYTADPGERNDITMTGLDDGVAEVHDSGAPVTAGTGCERVGDHDARCTAPEPAVTGLVHAGDGDDTVRLVDAPGSKMGLGATGDAGDDILTGTAYYSRLDGGPGRDTVTGGNGANTLRGGPGDDVVEGGPNLDDMFGGPGSDRLVGGGGDDLLRGDGDGAPASADNIDGGGGADTVLYTDRTIGVNIDLERPGGNGQPGENDHIVGVESVIGGGGSDRLAGDEGGNHLTGQNYGPVFSDTNFASPVRGEHDVLIGRRGNDALTGSPGPDVLFGGPGNDGLGGGAGARYVAGDGDDVVDLYDGRPRAISCGAGIDYVEGVARRDAIPHTCDTVQIDDLDVSTHLRRVHRVAVIAVLQKPDLSVSQSCRARVRLVVPTGRRGYRASLGEGVVRLRKDHRRNVRIALTALGRRLLVAGRRTRVEVQVRGLDRCNPRNNTLGGPIGAFTLAGPVERQN